MRARKFTQFEEERKRKVKARKKPRIVSCGGVHRRRRPRSGDAEGRARFPVEDVTISAGAFSRGREEETAPTAEERVNSPQRFSNSRRWDASPSGGKSMA